MDWYRWDNINIQYHYILYNLKIWSLDGPIRRRLRCDPGGLAQPRLVPPGVNLSSFVDISSCYQLCYSCARQKSCNVMMVSPTLLQGVLFLDIHLIRFVSFSYMQVQTFYITLQISSWDDYFYDLAARNSIDVGEFVGRCLAGVIQQWDKVQCIV